MYDGETFRYTESTLKNIINKKIINNSKIRDFVSEHNCEQELTFEYLLGGEGSLLDRKDFMFMLQLGIPVGVVETIDSRGKLILHEWDKVVGKVKYLYKPINSLEDCVEYWKINPYPDIIVNPKYMSKKQIRNIGYCLSQANNDLIFDFDTKMKLQIEIINSVPLKYVDAMEIFNKYYNESIHKKFIYKYGVERDRFYYLSGLNELIPPNKSEKKYER